MQCVPFQIPTEGQCIHVPLKENIPSGHTSLIIYLLELNAFLRLLAITPMMMQQMARTTMPIQTHRGQRQNCLFQKG
jgi:hypothetical protein